MRLEVFETGGTINGILSPDDPPPSESRVVAWLEEQAGHFDFEPVVRMLCMKDSRAVNDSDRSRLCDAIEASEAKAILVPHGTYTMAETGRYLLARLSPGSLGRTIVLVGSLHPLGAPDSDAPAALRFALRALSEGHPGVWVTLGDALWSPAEVDKDPETGRFRPNG